MAHQDMPKIFHGPNKNPPAPPPPSYILNIRFLPCEVSVDAYIDDDGHLDYLIRQEETTDDCEFNKDILSVQ